jgi:ABC-2 type transport system permease protein
VQASLLIAAKDLRQRARDRSLFILAFVAPLALAFVFSIVFSGLDDTGDRISFSYGVVDLDGGELARAFDRVLADLEASGLADVSRYDDVTAARAAVDDGDIAAVFVLPQDLSSTFATGIGVQLQVIGSADAPIATSVAGSIAGGFATRTSTAAVAGFTAADLGVIGPDQIAEVANQVSAEPPLASIEVAESDSGRLDLTTTLVAGLSVFFVFFVAGTSVVGILQERQEGTLPRLLIAPVSRAAILIGKSAAAIAVGIVALAALMVASTLLMGADWGPPGGALLLSSAAVLAAAGIMALVGGAARTAEQAGNLQAVVAVSMAMLGGSFGLVAPSTDSLWGRLALLTPNRWFLDGLEDLRVGGISEALPSLAALLVMAGVTGTAAALLARRMLRP